MVTLASTIFILIYSTDAVRGEIKVLQTSNVQYQYHNKLVIVTYVSKNNEYMQAIL